jgi:ribose transport system substrate-binding protein
MQRLSIAPATLAVIAAAMLAGCGHSKGGTAAPGTASGTSNANAGGAIQIAVIPKGTTHEYWKSVHAGAVKAEREEQQKGVNVHIVWKGPLREDDRNGQTDVVETFTTQKVNGIVLAPLDAEALVKPVEDAADKGIPVVIIDSALDSKKISSFVATDNHKGGVMAAQELIKELGGKGKVLMLRYAVGSASTEAREAGFMDTIKTAPGITVVSSDQYAGATVDTAYRSAQNVLGRYGKEIDGVFTPNESSTLGMRLGLKDIGKLGKVKFVGFDTSPELIDALKAGEVQALVAQNPFLMGYDGVTTMVDVIQKKSVPATVDTGVTLVTKDNLTDPKIADLINPPLDKYQE